MDAFRFLDNEASQRPLDSADFPKSSNGYHYAHGHEQTQDKAESDDSDQLITHAGLTISGKDFLNKVVDFTYPIGDIKME